MPRRALVALALIASAGLCGLAFAQQRPASPERTDAAPGRFAVAPAAETAVMVDTRAGKAWILRESADGRQFAWLPIQRFDNPKEASAWIDKEETIRARREERARPR